MMVTFMTIDLSASYHFFFLISKYSLPYPFNYFFEVDAIESIKNTYGVAKDWQGDPCAPKMFAWQGVNCSYDAPNPPTITGL